MSNACTLCATPLGARDRTCPTCGTAASRPAAPAATERRTILLDNPSPTAPKPPARARTPQPPRPAQRNRPALKSRPGAARARRRPAPGPAASGTVTNLTESIEVKAVGRGQRGRSAAGCALAGGSALALLLFGGAHRGPGLLLLLPTLIVVVALAAAPFLIPEDRARTVAARLQLTAGSGTVTTCELLGVPTDTPPRIGDLLEVFGRGAPVVRVDEIVRGGQRLRGRVPAPFLLARHAPTVACALSGMCALLAGVLVTTA